MRGATWTGQDEYRPVSDAKRFETWEFAWALVLGTGEAARYATAVGLEAIHDRVRALAGRLREGLGALENVRILDRGRELCGIVSVSIDGWDPQDLLTALRARRIHANAQIRAYAVIDYDDKGLGASMRLSPHYYNTEEEIGTVLDSIRRIALERP
jgi:selenocysteine lyase/cysteine desulfurase